ncbi:MAG: DUF262 domain-containing HNH endonuclease family protein [Paludibacteraceae bacterium]|nr:DUF262 domain-containing HNH endonuclease family protein [Bacteroidales bacterium]MDY4149515.1 DUF262 domain-containing HNH endonuclease family protein [Paludibacteraceae bacterium]
MTNKDIDPKLKLIKDYLKIDRGSFFVIPEYQRAYSWTVDQCDKLWQDINSYLDLGNDNEPYFFGTIIVDCSYNNGELHLIDGQQRTTTFLLLLKALYLRLQEVLKSFGHTRVSETLEAGLKENRDDIVEILYKANRNLRLEILNDWSKAKGNSLLINRSINEQYKDELQIILESKDYIETENRCYKIPHKQKDNKYTNFFKNFKFFYEKLGEKKESELNKFADGFLGCCQVIEICSWQTEQAITMFNSLNSTGLPLSDADIISAQMYSYAGKNRDEFNNQWFHILKEVSELTARDIVDIDAILQQYMYIYRAQKKEYTTRKEDGTLTINVTMPGVRRFYISDHSDILSDPITLCGNFDKIVRIWDNIKDYPEVRLLLKFNDNAKIYLAAYLYRYEVSNITHDIVIDICNLLMRLFAILELVDAGYSSANFKSFLFAEAIKLVDSNIAFSEIESDFSNHIHRLWDADSLLQDIGDYEKNVLVFLNEYLYAQSHKLRFDFSDSVNVEHIMPAGGCNIEIIRVDAGIDTKEEFQSIVNKLGNKILLEENINKSIGQEWFKTKKQKSVKDKLGYKDSHFGIASALVSYPNDTWTKTDIEAATNKSAERIVKFILND